VLWKGTGNNLVLGPLPGRAPVLELGLSGAWQKHNQNACSKPVGKFPAGMPGITVCSRGVPGESACV